MKAYINTIVLIFSCLISSYGENKLHGDSLMQIMTTMMSEIKAMKMTGNADHDFAMMMKRHHKGAIEMSKVETQKGRDNELKSIAAKMIDQQNKEIEQLNEMNMENGNEGAMNEEFMQLMMQHHNRADEKMKATTMTRNTDMDYATMMKMHHQMAIDMSNIYLKYGKDEKLKAMAEKMLADQRKEIEQLAGWVAKHKN